jgi:hypothetical protein
MATDRANSCAINSGSQKLRLTPVTEPQTIHKTWSYPYTRLDQIERTDEPSG